ncbi:MAG: hypothetical protein NXI16_10100 [Alphaproteobacteria bacterium]|nr:hypothetical protein [Alphaproteobacteria bacterium]
MTGIGGFDVFFDPLIAPGLIALLGGIGMLLAAFTLYRGGRGAFLRLAALTALVLTLLNPVLVAEERQSQPDIVLLVEDASESQTLEERDAQTAEALSALTTDLQAAGDLDVRRLTVNRGSGPETEGTQMMEAVEEALAALPRDRLGAIIAVTDGQIHDAERITAEQVQAPFHALITGDPDASDRQLTITQVPGFGLVGDKVSLGLQVDDTTLEPGTPIAIEVRVDGGPASPVQVPANRAEFIEIPIDHGGETIVEIVVPTRPDELTDRNNRAAVTINGVRDRLRVLLVSGEPHAGERTWRNLLKADPSVDLIHFTILRPPEKQDGTPIHELSLIAFPTRELFELRINDFDLIVLDRYRRRGVLPQLYLRNISRYVEDGGAVLMAAGPDFASPLSMARTPLRTILPASPTGQILKEGFRPEVSDIGLRHPVTTGLPGANTEDEDPTWGRWFRQIEASQSRGTTVMTGPGETPLVILDRIGEGRVAQMLSDHAWLWTRGYEGGGPQAELLRRMAHWLMKEPELEEERLVAADEDDRLLITRRSLGDAVSDVEVTTPAGETVTVALTEIAPGEAQGALDVTESGLYRISDGSETTLAAVGRLNPVEFSRPIATTALLTPIVDSTGGGIIVLQEEGVPALRRVSEDRATRGSDWIGIRRNGAFVVQGVTEVPLMPALLSLLLVGGLLTGAWLREAR